MTCEELAKLLSALGHEVRLRILAALSEGGEMYLSEIAEAVGVSRALAKVHLKVLERAGIVESNLVLNEERGKALRYYRVKELDLRVNLDMIREVCGSEGE